MKLNNETVYVSDYFIVKFIVVCSGVTLLLLSTSS